MIVTQKTKGEWRNQAFSPLFKYFFNEIKKLGKINKLRRTIFIKFNFPNLSSGNH